MIEFNFETDFELDNHDQILPWIEQVVKEEGFKVGEINYIFCDDSYLHSLNVKFLNHDTYTDIISFDYTLGNILQGDIFISVERVAENAKEYEVPFNLELYRVVIHGILHFCGYNDKRKSDAIVMRNKENYYLSKLS